MKTKQTVILDLLPEFILGAEGDEGAQSTDSGNDSGESQENAGSVSNDSSEEPEKDEHDDRDDPKVKGLRSALAAERARANKLEKEARARAKADEEKALKEKSEIEQAQIREQKAMERLQRLADGYRKSAVDRAIEQAASDFIDPNDAITGVDRSQIEVEQDEEDPSIVKVDKKSVERVVKALAAEKSHWLKKQGTDDGEKTGSTFGGSRQKSDKTKDEVYRQKYPSLR